MRVSTLLLIVMGFACLFVAACTPFMALWLYSCGPEWLAPTETWVRCIQGGDWETVTARNPTGLITGAVLWGFVWVIIGGVFFFQAAPP